MHRGVFSRLVTRTTTTTTVNDQHDDDDHDTTTHHQRVHHRPELPLGAPDADHDMTTTTTFSEGPDPRK
eukprot:9087152-Heterocapsa_arctica.AAC.1